MNFTRIYARLVFVCVFFYVRCVLVCDWCAAEFRAGGVCLAKKVFLLGVSVGGGVLFVHGCCGSVQERESRRTTTQHVNTRVLVEENRELLWQTFARAIIFMMYHVYANQHASIVLEHNKGIHTSLSCFFFFVSLINATETQSQYSTVQFRSTIIK